MGTERKPSGSELKDFDELAIKLKGTERHAQHLRHQEAVLKGKTEAYRGRIIDSTSTGLFSLFTNPDKERHNAEDPLENDIQNHRKSELKNKRFRNNPTPYLRWISATTTWLLINTSGRFGPPDLKQEILVTARRVFLSGERFQAKNNTQELDSNGSPIPPIADNYLNSIAMQIIDLKTDPAVLRELLNGYVNDPQRSVPELQRTEIQG